MWQKTFIVSWLQSDWLDWELHIDIFMVVTRYFFSISLVRFCRTRPKLEDQVVFQFGRGISNFCRHTLYSVDLAAMSILGFLHLVTASENQIAVVLIFDTSTVQWKVLNKEKYMQQIHGKKI